MRIVQTKTSDGINFNGLISEAENPKGIIIHIHGMAGSIVINSFYQSMHDEYTKNGWSFLVGELRGTGTVTQFTSASGVRTIGNAYEIFEECVFDIDSWINFARDLGYSNICLQGHSLGTSKIAYYLDQTHSKDIEKVILLSPSDMHGLVHDSTSIKEHEILLAEAERLIPSSPRELLSQPLWEDVLLSAQSYLTFFGQNSKDNIFHYKQNNNWEVLNSIKIPVLAITGTQDDGIVPVISANEAMEILKSQLMNSSKVKTIVFEGAEHDFNNFLRKK